MTVNYLTLLQKSHYFHGNSFNNFFLAQKIQVHKSPIYCLKWSPDGKYLAAGYSDGTILVWQLILSKEDRDQLKAKFTINGNADSTLEEDDGIILNPEPICKFMHKNTINSIDWSNNGFLLSAGADKSVKLWNIFRDVCLSTYIFSAVITCAKFVKDDDRFFVASQWDGEVYFFSILEKSIISQTNLQVNLMSLDTSSKLHTLEDMVIVASGEKGWIFVLDLLTLSLKFKHQFKRKKNTPRVTGVECFWESRHKERALHLPQLKNENNSHNHNYSHSNNQNHNLILNSNEYHKQQDPHLKILITTNDSKIRLLNLTTKCIEVRYQGYENKHSNIKASLNEDKEFVISGSEDGWVYFWHTGSGLRQISTGKMKNHDRLHSSSSSPSGSSSLINYDTNDHTGFKKIFKQFKPISDSIHNSFLFDSRAQNKNSNYSAFNLFHGRCNTAIWAPRTTVKLLELSDDPIWNTWTAGKKMLNTHENDSKDNLSDLINLSLTASTKSSEELFEDMLGNSIIVATDNSGVLKIVRQDFAYEFRKVLKERGKLEKKLSKKRASRKLTVSTTSSQTPSANNILIANNIPFFESRRNSIVTRLTVDTQDFDQSNHQQNQQQQSRGSFETELRENSTVTSSGFNGKGELDGFKNGLSMVDSSNIDLELRKLMNSHKDKVN